jgi:hypothetical protein
LIFEEPARVLVSLVPLSIKNKDLHRYFEKYGDIVSVESIDFHDKGVRDVQITFRNHKTASKVANRQRKELLGCDKIQVSLVEASSSKDTSQHARSVSPQNSNVEYEQNSKKGPLKPRFLSSSMFFASYFEACIGDDDFSSVRDHSAAIALLEDKLKRGLHRKGTQKSFIMTRDFTTNDKFYIYTNTNTDDAIICQGVIVTREGYTCGDRQFSSIPQIIRYICSVLQETTEKLNNIHYTKVSSLVTN